MLKIFDFMYSLNFDKGCMIDEGTKLIKIVNDEEVTVEVVTLPRCFTVSINLKQTCQPCIHIYWFHAKCHKGHFCNH